MDQRSRTYPDHYYTMFIASAVGHPISSCYFWRTTRRGKALRHHSAIQKSSRCRILMNSTSSNFSQDDSPMQDDELMTNLRKRIEEQELKEQDEAPLEYSVDASVARTIQIDADSEDNVWLIKGTWEDPDEFFTMDAGDAAYVIVLNSEEDAQLLLRVLSFQDQIPPTSAVERLTWRSVLAYTNDIGLEFGFIETGQLVSSLSKEDLDRIRARGDLNDKNLVERLKNVFEREMFDSSAPASDIPAWEQIDGEQGEDKDDKDVDER